MAVAVKECTTQSHSIWGLGSELSREIYGTYILAVTASQSPGCNLVPADHPTRGHGCLCADFRRKLVIDLVVIQLLYLSRSSHWLGNCD